MLLAVHTLENLSSFPGLHHFGFFWNEARKERRWNRNEARKERRWNRNEATKEKVEQE